MSSFFEKLPPHARKRVTQMADELDSQDAHVREKIAASWLEKMNAFQAKTHMFGMVEVTSFHVDEPRGALVMTYSGSILLLGPPKNGRREATYTSVGSRTGVPPVAKHGATHLAKDIAVNSPVSFAPGPVTQTSEVYRIAVCNTTGDMETQQAKLAAAADEITSDFTAVNHTFVG